MWLITKTYTNGMSSRHRTVCFENQTCKTSTDGSEMGLSENGLKCSCLSASMTLTFQAEENTSLAVFSGRHDMADETQSHYPLHQKIPADASKFSYTWGKGTTCHWIIILFCAFWDACHWYENYRVGWTQEIYSISSIALWAENWIFMFFQLFQIFFYKIIWAYD